MNDTMIAFGELQERREHAEREAARIFETSLDLMCVIGFDGYFKRVNPAFERTLGYSRDELLSRRGFDFAHPDDLDSSSHIFSALTRGEQVEQFENRNICADGSIRWLEWSARAVLGEGLVYAVARDITESRRAGEEQAALRRVATLVARAVASEVVFAAVAEEAGRLMSADIAMIARYGAGPSATGIVGWRSDGQPASLGADIKLGGRNVASAVFRSGRPARIDSYAAGSGEVAGWAQGIGIRSSVGVPITVEGRLWGVMTVSSETDESLPPDTEDRLSGFTELAATAIANAEARAELRHFANEQAGLRRVATLVARGVPRSIVFGVVAEEVAKVLPGVDLALVGHYTPDHSIEFVGGWSSFGEAEWVGKTVPIGGRNVTTAVFETEQPARVDRLEDDATDVTAVARESGARSSAGAPIMVEGQLWGIMTVASVHEDTLAPGIENELAAFTELIATAIANADGRAQLVAARRRVIEATDAARAKLARDIHDGAQQQFLTALIDLQLAQQKRSSDAGRSRELVDLAAGQVETGVETLRDLAAGVHPAILSDMGLKAALDALAGRMPIPLSLEVDDLDLPETLESSIYFFCSEALANVVKHAAASCASVQVEIADQLLTVKVRDDGVGGAEIGAGGTGLIGLRDRIGALDGTLSVSSPSGGAGTTLVAQIPLPS
jgi:PAS domain S-box-containing protein